MGIHVIKMPDIGEGIAEVELVEWHVQPGDLVKEDQSLADVMTDKASVEIPTPVAGKVLELGGKPGDVMAVGSELIRIEVEGEGNFKGDAAAPRAAAASDSSAPVAAAKAEAVAAAKAAKSEASTSANAPSRESSAPANATTRAASAPAQAKTSKPHIPAKATASSAPPTAAQPSSAQPTAPTSITSGDQPLASPAVRKRARDLGIELDGVRGSGPDGRILHEDLDTYRADDGKAPDRRGAVTPKSAQSPQTAPTTQPAQYAERTDEETVPVIGLRRKIAQKMQESKRRIPHFTYVEEVDVTELEALRAKLNARWGATRGKLTLLPFLMRAIVRTTPAFPQINARYDDDNAALTRYGAVHIGIATQTEAGLVVPVVRHAEARDLWSCAGEVARLADAARTGKSTRDELTGSTITITSLGPLGGIVTTPVINYPEVAIVGVNRIVERPVIRNGAIQPRLLMNLSSSFDHRVVDGMQGAEFVQALRGFLEHPATLFIE
jgi:2-oxoisovalerate dehydrogenase E2 component (dihydrolipoyl transacylase)